MKKINCILGWGRNHENNELTTFAAFFESLFGENTGFNYNFVIMDYFYYNKYFSTKSSG